MSRPITTASCMQRRALCAGSERQEAAAPPSEDSELSSRCTDLHAVLAGEMSADELSEFEAWMLEFAKTTLAQIVESAFPNETPECYSEIEFDFAGIKRFGKADKVYVGKKSVLVVDWALGFLGKGCAAENLQTRSYLVMACERFRRSGGLAVLIQPRLPADQRVSIAHYGPIEILVSRVEMERVLAACKAPDAPLCPGDAQCKYCRARATCPALASQADELTIVDQNAITVQNAADIYRKCKLVEKHLGALKSRVHLIVSSAEAEGREVPGIAMKPGAKRRNVTDAQKAFEALVMEPGAFIDCCTVKVGELEAAFKAAHQLKGKDGKEEFEKRLNEAGALETKQAEASLVLTDSRE